MSYCKDYAEREVGIIVAMYENALRHLCTFLKFSITFLYGENFFLCLYRYYALSSFQSVTLLGLAAVSI